MMAVRGGRWGSTARLRTLRGTEDDGGGRGCDEGGEGAGMVVMVVMMVMVVVVVIMVMVVMEVMVRGGG